MTVLFFLSPIVGVCKCSMFCCTLLYVHSSFAIILIGKRELVAFLSLSSCCLVMVERLFLAVPWGCLLFVIVVFSDHTHYFNSVSFHEKICQGSGLTFVYIVCIKGHLISQAVNISRDTGRLMVTILVS